MKKKKNVFPLFCTILLLVLSVSAVSLYDNIQTSKTYRYDHIESYYEEEFQCMTLDLAMQVNEDYFPLDLQGLEEDQKQYEEKRLRDSIYDTRSFVNADNDFYYVAENLKTHKVVTNIKNYEKESLDTSDTSYFVDLTYDEKGILKMDGDAQEDIFSNLNELFLDDPYYETEEEYSSLSVINPTNLHIQYMIAANPTSVYGISGYVNSWERYSPFATTLLLVFSAIVALFILIYPMEFIASSGLFKRVKEWSIEINILLWTTIVSLVFIGVSSVVGNSINGNFANQLMNFGFSNVDSMVLAINLLMWLYSLLSIAITVFLVKYIVMMGPITYIRSHSLILDLLYILREKLRSFENLRLTEDIRKPLIQYIGLHGLIIFLICFVGSIDGMLAFVLVVMYMICLYIYLKKRVFKVQSDYDHLLSCIQGIISEDFNREEQDLGIFDSSKEELNQLSENFEQAIQEKVRSQKLKTELISNVSHDLKTPLTCIKNYITLLKDDSISKEERDHYMDQLTLYSNRLKNLIEDLFEISKVDSGNIQLNKQELDVVSLLNQVHLENEDLLEPKGLTVIKKYAVEKAMAHLDSDKTYRIFENLFTNISKYAMDHSRVYITLSETKRSIEIEFSNISEVPMDFTSEEITERFVRGDKSRSKQGSGLGLAIARSFTEAQGGNFLITVDCDLFKVHILLPKDSE